MTFEHQRTAPALRMRVTRHKRHKKHSVHMTASGQSRRNVPQELRREGRDGGLAAQVGVYVIHHFPAATLSHEPLDEGEVLCAHQLPHLPTAPLLQSHTQP